MKPLLTLIGIVLLAGCATRTPEIIPVSIPYKILFLSPQLRYHDMGFVRYNNENVWLEVYTLGKPMYKITITDYHICMPECYPKSSVIAHIFGEYAPTNILENILLRRDIYNGENIIDTDGVLSQRIERKDSSIHYVRTPTRLTFTDSMRKVKITLENTNH